MRDVIRRTLKLQEGRMDDPGELERLYGGDFTGDFPGDPQGTRFTKDLDRREFDHKEVEPIHNLAVQNGWRRITWADPTSSNSFTTSYLHKDNKNHQLHVYRKTGRWEMSHSDLIPDPISPRPPKDHGRGADALKKVIDWLSQK